MPPDDRPFCAHLRNFFQVVSNPSANVVVVTLPPAPGEGYKQPMAHHALRTRPLTSRVSSVTYFLNGSIDEMVNAYFPSWFKPGFQTQFAITANCLHAFLL